MQEKDLVDRTQEEWRSIGVAEVADRDLVDGLSGITNTGSARVIPSSGDLKRQTAADYDCEEVRLEPLDGYPLKNVRVYVR